MNCRETERLLDTFYDGELDGRLMRDAAMHVTRCPSCEREVQRRETLHDLLTQTISEEIGSSGPVNVWSAIEAKLGEETLGSTPRLAAASSSLKGVLVGSGWRRKPESVDSEWMRGSPPRRFGRTLSVAGLSALAASVLVLLLFAGGEDRSTDGTTTTTTAAMEATSKVPGKLENDVKFFAARAGGAAVPVVANRGGEPTRVADGRSAPRQVQIDALEYTGGPMALWREPASETTIIWIGDSDPRVRKPGR